MNENIFYFILYLVAPCFVGCRLVSKTIVIRQSWSFCCWDFNIFDLSKPFRKNFSFVDWLQTTGDVKPGKQIPIWNLIVSITYIYLFLEPIENEICRSFSFEYQSLQAIPTKTAKKICQLSTSENSDFWAQILGIGLCVSDETCKYSLHDRWVLVLAVPVLYRLSYIPWFILDFDIVCNYPWKNALTSHLSWWCLLTKTRQQHSTAYNSCTCSNKIFL